MISAHDIISYFTVKPLYSEAHLIRIPVYFEFIGLILLVGLKFLIVKFNTLEFETPLIQTDLEFELEGFPFIRLSLFWGPVH